ncbi:MAG: phage Gp37/Gp68 family protein [Mesorhizobium sp.]|nr:MAG: phage Gp37/Gp68 family protein [Mesorhizobium sp.]
MADKSAIEWTDATWNPIVGCSILSPGCTHCYAMRMAARIEAMGGAKHYAGTTKKVNGNTIWTGKLALAPEHILTQPLRWARPRRIFVNSMGDMFHEDVPYEWIDRVFAVMALAPQHTFQVLTKRAARMRAYASGFECDGARRLNVAAAAGRMMEDGDNAHDYVANLGWPLPNVWLGVSAERRVEWLERTTELRQTPAAVRFVSAEPLLGDLGQLDLTGLDWIIAGGESGPDSRPMHPAWPRSIRDQCQAAGVPFFFKQWGEWNTRGHAFGIGVVKQPHAEIDGLSIVAPWGREDVIMARVGKKAAGRLLDGIEHNAMPELREVPAL